jgi:hypothetical protein
MINSNETRKRVGIGEFMDKALSLPNEEFEKAMRLDNNDKDINEIKMVAWTEDEIEAYERN